MTSLRDSADVTFFDLKTGKPVVFFNSTTISSVEINRSREDVEQAKSSFDFNRTFSMEIDYIDGRGLALLYGKSEEPEIKKLIKLMNKTKKKRIKNKLNKRILSLLFRD